MSSIPIRSITEFTIVFRNVVETEPESNWVQAMSAYYLVEEALPVEMRASDPFSDEYERACHSFLLAVLEKNAYSPLVDERSYYDELLLEDPYHPYMFHSRNTETIGNNYIVIGEILRALNIPFCPSTRILECGPGDGQISLALARSGCQVTAIDVEQRFLDAIRRQATSFGVDITTIHGSFGSGLQEGEFDCILFYEAFHHCFDHMQVLLALRKQLKPTGKMIFAGEPIYRRDSIQQFVMPVPWGPRLDGGTLCISRDKGWCELGFQQNYFVEALMRSGLLVRIHKNPNGILKDIYIAEIAGDSINLGGSHLVATTLNDDGWYEGEGQIRWTKGNASIGLDQSRKAVGIVVTMVNYFSIEKKVILDVIGSQVKVICAPGETRSATILLPSDYSVLKIITSSHVISKVIPNCPDDRKAGIAIKEIRYI